MPHRFQGIVDLANIFSQHGITKAVVSPGSRNVPLINVFTQNPNFECVSVVDERAAAYYALGMAIKMQRPVVLFCTSGTAALNYAPAVAEAFHQKIPLIILTADRPPELINQRDNQTINQVGIYSNFIAKEFLFPVETEKDADIVYAHRIANEAASLAEHLQKPVHINIPLREPLYIDLPLTTETKIITPDRITSDYSISDELAEIWKDSKQIVVLAGQNNFNPEIEMILSKLTEDKSVVVLAENLSNLHLQNSISTVERLFLFLRSNPDSRYAPDLLITLGGSVVSKQIKLFLRENKPQYHWHISEEFEMVDTYNSLTHTINYNPVKVLSSLNSIGKKTNSNYQGTMLKLDNKLEELQQGYLNTIGFSDLAVFKKITETLPSSTNFHLGNSTPIRYSQLFNTKQDISYFSNRGVSGIDGCISTAAGFSRDEENISLLVIGDISFLYDSNALWIQTLSKNLCIIVINNGGGDIFRWINSSENEKLGGYIETPQNVNLELLTKACGLDYLFSDDSDSFICGLRKLYEPSDKPVVLEVNTSKQPNAEIVRKLYKSFKEFKNEQY